MDYSKRFYKTVVSGTPQQLDQTPANGEKIHIVDIGGNAARNAAVRVEISFGSEIILSTHGDTVQKCDMVFTGDGTKKLTIKLINDSGADETIGAYYIAKKK